MRSRQTLPRLWLISDARTDAGLEAALRRLPRGSGLVFRHYHLPPEARAVRFRALLRLCRLRGLVAVWAGTAREARARGAAGFYGAPRAIGAGPRGLRLATAHSLREIGMAGRADALLLSPVFPTRSHPGAANLGPVRFLLLARQSRQPVIALGGVTEAKARRLPGHGWAAIDGLSHKMARIPLDS